MGNDMERLTRRSITGEADCAYCNGDHTPDGQGCSPHCELWNKQMEKLAAYEDAEEQGLLLRLPCTIGDDVYFIPSKVNYELNIISGLEKHNKVYHQKVKRIVIVDATHWYVECDKDREYGTGNICLDAFYKETWFLTRAEAEKALEEMG